MYCLVSIFREAEGAVCIVWLPFLCVCVMLKMLCVYCLASSFCNVEEGSINTCTPLSPEDGVFLIWLPPFVMLKKGV